MRKIKKVLSKIRRRKKLPASALRRAGEARKKQLPKYKAFRLQKKIKPKKYKKLPSAWFLWRESLRFFWKHKKKIGLFLLVYAVTYYIFVNGLSGGINLKELKETFEGGSSPFGNVFNSLILFGILLSTSNATDSEVASLYQVVLLVIGSLAMIWLLRQLSAERTDKKIRVKDSFYKGMQQLIPFVLVLVVLLLEFIPLSLGGTLFSVVLQNGIASSGVEVFSVGVVALLLATLSLYLISGSAAALYIVTIPDVQPMQALRTSHRMLALHRKSVVRKLLLLTVFIVLAALVVMLPLLVFLPNSWLIVTEYVFFACVIASFAIFHIYMYTFYKSLI